MPVIQWFRFYRRANGEINFSLGSASARISETGPSEWLMIQHVVPQLAEHQNSWLSVKKVSEKNCTVQKKQCLFHNHWKIHRLHRIKNLHRGHSQDSILLYRKPTFLWKKTENIHWIKGVHLDQMEILSRKSRTVPKNIHRWSFPQSMRKLSSLPQDQKMIKEVILRTRKRVFLTTKLKVAFYARKTLCFC